MPRRRGLVTRRASTRLGGVTLCQAASQPSDTDETCSGPRPHRHLSCVGAVIFDVGGLVLVERLGSMFVRC